MASHSQARSSRSPPDHSSYGSPQASLPAASSFNSRYSSSPHNERRSLDKSAVIEPSPRPLDGNALSIPTVLIRRLPIKMSIDALNSMFLFAEDFQDSRFVDNPEEPGFLAAIARFGTVEGAYEVRDRLNGKMNSTGEAPMLVELLHMGNSHAKSQTSDGPSLSRQMSNAASSRGSPVGRQTSRYFQSMGEKVAPISLPPSVHNGDDASMPPHGFFSPRSPTGSSFDAMRITGKSMISEDNDETEELLKDPVAYAKSNHSGPVRRNTSSSRPPTLRLGNLSLNTQGGAVMNGTSLTSPTSGGFMHSRQGPGSPGSELSPTLVNGMSAMSPTSAAGFPMSPTQMQQRHHYPPANPADQNPPCNTLYVGNLPVDTSEDELKAVFSKQRGYKRLCFRTKHNGPMCFVEFEDVSFATKALNELYGHPLHNSVKGGIRLSFSKNPLGVRTGQNNPMSINSPIGGSGLGGLGGPSFSTASGPPPGLAIPPGLTSPGVSSNLGAGGSFFSSNGQNGGGPIGQRSSGNSFIGAGLGAAASSTFPDGMAGR